MRRVRAARARGAGETRALRFRDSATTRRESGRARARATPPRGRPLPETEGQSSAVCSDEETASRARARLSAPPAADAPVVEQVVLAAARVLDVVLAREERRRARAARVEEREVAVEAAALPPALDPVRAAARAVGGRGRRRHEARARERRARAVREHDLGVVVDELRAVRGARGSGRERERENVLGGERERSLNAPARGSRSAGRGRAARAPGSR